MAALFAVLATAASAETVPLPAGAATGSSADYQITSSACPSAGNCVAVGSYADGAGRLQGLIATESTGSWSAGQLTMAGLAVDATDPKITLQAVSCASAGNCVAVGHYLDAAAETQGVIATESNGSWSAARVDLSSLPSVYSNPGVSFEVVSCPDAGDCVAVGSYQDGSNTSQPLIVSEHSGTWTTILPGTAALGANGPASLSSVSCPSAGNCVAVGGYQDSHGEEGLVVTDSAGVWTATRANVSALSNINSGNPGTFLQSVSCPTAGNCTAVGYYDAAVTGGTAYEGLLINQSNGIWSAATEAALPSGYSATGTTQQEDLYVNAVSCASPGNCTAVGSYDAGPSDSVEGLQLSETNGNWSVGIATTLPSAAATDPQASLDSVSCTSAGNCLAAGTYATSDGRNAALLVQQSGGNWSSADAGQSSTNDPTAYTYYKDDALATASCAAGGYCIVAGYTADHANSGNDVGFLFTAPAAPGVPVAQVSGTTATVSWTAPADDGGFAVKAYTVTANDVTDPAAGGQSVTVDGSITQTPLGGLVPDHSYTFTVTSTGLLGTGLGATSASVFVPASVQQIKTSLAGLLAPRGAGARLKRLRHTHAYTFTYQPLEAGTVTVRWYETTGHGKHRHRHLFATGTANATGATALKLHVHLTGFGRRAAKKSKRLHLGASVTFKAATGGSTTRTRRFTLR